MNPRIRWAAPQTWDEVLFFELHHDDGRSSWLRYIITSDGANATASVWALHCDGFAWTTGLHTAPVRSHDGSALDTDGGTWRPGRITGSVGAITWDLHVSSSVAGHDHVPALLQRAGLGRTYRSEGPDARVAGVMTVNGTILAVRSRGVAGHIWGSRNRTQRWAWCHAAGMDDAPDVVFEGLTAVLLTPSAPPLTSLMLHTPHGRRAFSGLRDLYVTQSELGNDRWTFVARRPGLVLSGEARLGRKRALVEYADDRGQPIWCENSPTSTLVLSWSEVGSPTRTWRTDRASFEVASRNEPDRKPLLGPR